MRNACDSDSRCGLACDASERPRCQIASDVGRAMRATKATSLGPKPSLFVFCCFCFLFFLVPFLALNRKPLFSPEKGHFLFTFSVSLSFSQAFFGLPLFHFHFLCLSLFLSSFLLVFFFAFFLFLVFVSFFCFFLSSSLLFNEKNNIKIFNYKVFVHQSFLNFIAFLFFLSNPLSLSILFSCFFVLFLFNINVLLKKCKFQKHQFVVKRGVAT